MLRYQLSDIIEAALKRRPLSLVINDAKILNVFTGEISRGSIGVYKDTIVYTGSEKKKANEIIDAKQVIAIPGLIDTHLHIESTMMTPSRFAEAVLPYGTTTVCADPHEIANVLGKEGVRMMIENSRNLPMKIYFFTPTCVPESDAVTSGSEMSPKDIEETLNWEGICGLGEVMDYDGLLSMKTKMIKILEIGRRRKSVIDGHSPLLTGSQLAAYVATGPEADHENFEVESAIEKLRDGMYLKLRGPDVLDTKKFINEIRRLLPSPWNILLVTDDVMPDRLAQFGHLNNVCRSAVEAGMDPIEVVRSVTLRPAQHMRMHDLGAIAPGKKADVVLIKDLKSFEVDTVVSGGRVAVRHGKLAIKVPKNRFNRAAFQTVRIRTLGTRDFEVNYGMRNGRVRLNCIDFSPYRREIRDPAKAFLQMVLTKLSVVDARVEDGNLLSEDISPAFVFERHGRTKGRRVVGFTRNLIQRGAYASTVAHDAHNLVVVGRDARDMELAANLVINSQGGMSSVYKERVLARIKLPVAGLMSERSLASLSKDMLRMRRAFKAMGMIDHPYMPMANLLTLSVIPHARITDKGTYDVDRRRFLPAILAKKRETLGIPQRAMRK